MTTSRNFIGFYYLAGIFVGLTIGTGYSILMILAAILVIVGMKIEEKENQRKQKMVIVDLLADNYTRVRINDEFIVGGRNLDLEKTKYLIRKLGYDVNTQNDNQE